MKIAIVASVFNREVVDPMVDLALKRAKELNLKVTTVVRVPGTFEIPLAVQRLIDRDDVDGVVALGAVIQGETKHDEVIMRAAADALLQIGVRSGKPVGLGVTGPGMTMKQAKARVDAAVRAVDAAKSMHDLLRGL